MNKVSITKEFTWDMAHMLAGHEGLCKNLHGHSYKMQVEVGSADSGMNDNLNNGMIIDFKDLKEIVKKEIVNPLDHSFVYWDKSPDKIEYQIAQLLMDSGRKVVGVQYRPTAEEMVFDFYNRLMTEFMKYNIKLLSIKLWETETSFAEIRGEY
ncbi:MAG: 6-carboxytetrahydropterin synthase [Bacillota bacterium]|nr:6-carboxytetrahydropterin synthase [Bacillota bacterium]